MVSRFFYDALSYNPRVLLYFCFWSTETKNNWQVGSLLEHTVGHIDPLHLVNKVPAGMSIPRSVLSLHL